MPIMRPQHKILIKNPLIATLAAVLLAACGGGGGGGGGGGNPPPPPPPPFSANFSEIQTSVFTPNCATAGCHTSAGAPQGLRLDAVNSYGLLVGVASSEVPAILRVAAGDPDNSYLIQKLEGNASVGARMPLNASALAQSDIDTIRLWITNGAVDDRAPSASPIRVTSLSPVPGSDLLVAPANIVAMFDRELDVSTVAATTFLLEGSGGDGTFGDGNETSITAAAITTPAMAPMSATFDLSGVALADDTYQVRILGAGASVLLDLDANALDGEFSGAFPSGDGTQGGDFEATFTLTTAVSAPTLDDLQASVFGPTCSNAGCHSGPTGGILPSGMDLTDADATFASLVGVASIQAPGTMRVAAGDPDNSYLIQKLEGTAATGVQMPAVGGPLNQSVIDDVRLWITDGANR
jgi:hypothetical protein